MESNNIYLKMYRRKSSDILRLIINNPESNNEMITLAIDILSERNEADENLLNIKKNILEEERKTKGINATEKYKTFWPRYFSLFIDGIFIGIVGYLIKFLLEFSLDVFITFGTVLSTFLPHIYYIVLHGKFGQTFGKMLMDVKIFDKSEKKEITYKQALMRDIVPLFSSIVLYVIFVSGINKKYHSI